MHIHHNQCTKSCLMPVLISISTNDVDFHLGITSAQNVEKSQYDIQQ